MRIGIDYRPAWSHAPGVGRYARELVRALSKLPAPPELALFELGNPHREVDEAALGIAGSHAITKRLRGPVPRRFVRWLGRAGVGADRLLNGVELFQQTAAEPLPITYARQCTAVAELPPIGSSQAAAHSAWLRSLDGLLVFSAHARQRLIDECAVEPDRIHFTPVGCEHWRRDLASGDLHARVNESSARPLRLIALGALHRNRHPLALLAALELLRKRGIEVELTHIGRAGNASDEWLQRRAASSAATVLHWIASPLEADLPRQVANADLLVHLAESELTPVTVLEACSLGPSVVAHRLPALEEALGELGEWLEPGCDDPERIADAILRGLARSSAATERHAREALSERFDWRTCALQTQLAWRRISSTLRARS